MKQPVIPGARQWNLLFLLLAVLATTPAQAFRPPTSDLPGSTDHPELGRIPGAFITQHQHRRFGTLRFPLNMARRGVGEVGRAEGEVWKITYYLPADMGPDGAAAVYRRNLEEKGFELVFDHIDPKGLLSLTRVEKETGEDFPPLSRPIHILVGKGTLRGRQATVVAYAYTQKVTGGQHQWVRLRIVESKPLDAGLDVVGAEKMADEIGAKGHIALYGILFDHDSDRLKPESNKTLKEIAKYLKSHPQVKLYVVGHTDSTGSYDYNLDLSRRRAASAVKALTGKLGVSPNRLKPVGVGPVAPVASNETEEGRARNRRVELVAQ